MSERETLAKTHMFERCATALASLHPARAGTQEPFAFFIPGRIEVLGKHTDYAGGRSLLCAMDRGFAVMALPRNDRHVRAISVSSGEVREIVAHELERYSGTLAQKPRIVCGSKLDANIEGNSEKLRAYAEKHGYPYHEISAVTGAGVKELVRKLARAVREGEKREEAVATAP